MRTGLGQSISIWAKQNQTFSSGRRKGWKQKLWSPGKKLKGKFPTPFSPSRIHLRFLLLPLQPLTSFPITRVQGCHWPISISSRESSRKEGGQLSQMTSLRVGDRLLSWLYRVHTAAAVVLLINIRQRQCDNHRGRGHLILTLSAFWLLLSGYYYKINLMILSEIKNVRFD